MSWFFQEPHDSWWVQCNHGVLILGWGIGAGESNDPWKASFTIPFCWWELWGDHKLLCLRHVSKWHARNESPDSKFHKVSITLIFGTVLPITVGKVICKWLPAEHLSCGHLASMHLGRCVRKQCPEPWSYFEVKSQVFFCCTLDFHGGN